MVNSLAPVGVVAPRDNRSPQDKMNERIKMQQRMRMEKEYQRLEEKMDLGTATNRDKANYYFLKSIKIAETLDVPPINYVA